MSGAAASSAPASGRRILRARRVCGRILSGSGVSGYDGATRPEADNVHCPEAIIRPGAGGDDAPHVYVRILSAGSPLLELDLAVAHGTLWTRPMANIIEMRLLPP
ncbi:MAG: hypothetical protein R2854_01880 [Caldilineaceae bacterium]